MEHSIEQIEFAVAEYLDHDFYFVDEFADELIDEVVEDFDYYF